MILRPKLSKSEVMTVTSNSEYQRDSSVNALLPTHSMASPTPASTASRSYRGTCSLSPTITSRTSP